MIPRFSEWIVAATARQYEHQAPVYRRSSLSSQEAASFQTRITRLRGDRQSVVSSFLDAEPAKEPQLGDLPRRGSICARLFSASSNLQILAARSDPVAGTGFIWR